MEANNHQLAELIEWQARCADLENANEALREEREQARSTADLLMHECARLEARVTELSAFVDRLRIAVQQGAEL